MPNRNCVLRRLLYHKYRMSQVLQMSIPSANSSNRNLASLPENTSPNAKHQNNSFYSTKNTKKRIFCTFYLHIPKKYTTFEHLPWLYNPNKTIRIKPIPSQLLSRNAAHTLATLAHFVEKYGFALSSAIHHLILKRA